MTETQTSDGVFDLQQVYAEQAGPFRFRWADRVWELPHLRMLDFEVQLKVATFADSLTGVTDVEGTRDRINDLFSLIMGVEQGEAWAKVQRPVNMIGQLFEQWTKHSGAAEGESSASNGSSTSTGRPSKPTSTASTTSASRRRTPVKKAAAGRRGNS
jgi:hypothetical protein